MTITVTCQCGKSFAAKESLAGKRVRCPGCGNPFSIPDAASAKQSAAKQNTASQPHAGPLVVSCRCGKRFAAQPHLAGKTVSCPGCGGQLKVPSGAAPTATISTGQSLVASCRCGKRFAAQPHLAGKTVHCPGCGQELVVPLIAAPAAADPFASLPSAASGRSSTADDSFWNDALAAESSAPTSAGYSPLVYSPPPSLSQWDAPVRRRRGTGGLDLRGIAICQKGMILSMLASMLCSILTFAAPAEIRVFPLVVWLAVSIAYSIFFVLLSLKVYNLALGIVLGVLSQVPCVTLVILLVVNGKATSVLRQHGVKVGLLGASLSDV